MKKVLSLILLALLPQVSNAYYVQAYDAKINGIYYNFYDKSNEAEVMPEFYEYDDDDGMSWWTIPSYSGSVVIPESVTYNGKTYSVTSIGWAAFNQCRDLTSITIPNSVTSIGSDAFLYCGVKKVIVPDIAAWCGISFGNEYANPSVYAHHLFSDEETEIKNLVIPNGVTSIGGCAFYGCSGLTSVTIPNSVTSIGDGAFSGCSSLQYNEYGNAYYLGNNENPYLVFIKPKTTDITTCAINEGCKFIHSDAFSSCSGLTSITIPNSVTGIGSGAFSRCSGLTSVTIGNGVTSIGASAFSECSGLTSVTIPNSVTSIGVSAFRNCTSLTSVTIGNGVTSIGGSAFYNCNGLQKVIVPDIAAWFDISFGDYTANPLSSAQHLFCDETTEIKDLVIPNGVNIKKFVLSGCSGLTSVTIPSSVTSIGYEAFYGCSGLTDVYCYAKNVPQTNYYVFDYSPIGSATLHVPAESVELYKTTSPWNKFGTIVPIDGDMPEPKKCATPTISYTNGELTFSCDTEGAVCQSTITDTDISSYSTNKVQLSVTYTITVYATKSGYEDSEVATAILCWIDQKPDMEGITDDNATQVTMIALPVLIQTQGGIITIQGAAEGTPIAVYDTSGKQYGSTISEKNRTTISTSLQPGTTAIVKIGEKAVKVVIK
jgi:hypothetical protein